MSTVGSASATGSMGGRTTTWASGSAKASRDGEEDEMSVDADQMDGVAGGSNFRDLEAENDRFSASAMDEDMEDGMSDNTSLVGFGEGAGSTVSGPTYSRRDLAASPAAGRSALANMLQRDNSGVGTPSMIERERRDARMLDGISDDPNDTAARGIPARGAGGVETAERIMRDRLDEGEGTRKALGSPDEAGLGKFYFEEKK